MKTRITFLFTLLLFWGSLSAQRFHGQKIVGYIPDYGNISQVDYSNLTHSIFCFLSAQEDGTISPQNSYSKSQMQLFLNKTENTGTTRLITIWGDATLSKVSQDEVKTKRLVDSLVSFCKHNSFQGVDVDWEGLFSTQDSTDFKTFMIALKKGLKPEGLDLVVTVGFGSYWGPWYPDEGIKQADWIQVMIYSMTGSWAASPFGNHASFEDFQNGGNYWINRGYSKDKLVLGVPFYGEKFKSTAGGLADPITYKDIVAAFPDMDESMDQTPGNDLTVFNGPETMRKKSQYLIDNEFGGIFVWEMTQDAIGDKSLHKQIVCTYNGTSCVMTNLNLSQNTPSISIYPNPGNGKFSINIDQIKVNQSALLTITNSVGQKVKEYNLNTLSTTINASELEAGIYYLTVSTDQLQLTEKLIVDPKY